MQAVRKWFLLWPPYVIRFFFFFLWVLLVIQFGFSSQSQQSASLIRVRFSNRSFKPQDLQTKTREKSKVPPFDRNQNHPKTTCYNNCNIVHGITIFWGAFEVLQQSVPFKKNPCAAFLQQIWHYRPCPTLDFL